MAQNDPSTATSERSKNKFRYGYPVWMRNAKVGINKRASDYEFYHAETYGAYYTVH